MFNSAKISLIYDGFLRRRARGLPERDWYRHFIYAPGLLTGYGVKTLPGVREAIEGARWDEANRYAGITAEVLGAYCDGIDRATALLSRK